MCGIAGFNWPDRELGYKMIEEIVHRGPDQQGVEVTGDATLGAVRLSILDLSPNGSQPMHAGDGRHWIAYNGEVYNFREVRRHLEARGHVFKSGTDTEVVLRAYVEHGPRCLDLLRGMFAFAIYDAHEREFFLARDPVGIKPLYYRIAGGKLLFASEIKALLADPDVPRDVDPQALYDYLGWEFVPAPRTMFHGVKKLPAGHYLRVGGGKHELRRYWDLNFDPEEHAASYYSERLRELLDDAVRRHLVSDVPVGVFLSGGLDSSAITAFMRRHVRGRLRTFTLAYDDPSFSELEHARRVARAFGAEQHELMIEPVSVPLIEQAVWHLDEPMTDLSTIPFMLISREARRHVTVCLSGEGGDEIFVGYDRFRASRFDASIYRRFVPGWMRRGVISAFAARLPDQPQKKGALNVIKRFVQGADLPLAGEHLRWQYFLRPEDKEGLFRRELLAEVETDPFAQLGRRLEGRNDWTRLARELYLDFQFIMADSLLMKADKMSMASSLEVRVPLLDLAVVEFAATIPDRLKYRGATTKVVLRQALRGLLPPATVGRGKQGYSLPIKNWLREELRPYMTQLLNESPVIREHLNVGHVNRLIHEHVARTHNHNHLLWALMNLAAWHKLFVLGSSEAVQARKQMPRAGVVV
jgi:asparagine synthase (glutamine-hydrolysing)